MSNGNFLTKTLAESALSRRSFLKWSAVLGGTAAAAGALNYGLKVAETASAAGTGEGKWVAAACWHNCGGRCLNKAYVVDGVVTKQKTDDTHPDSPDYPQQRGCARGRSQRMRAFGADRLKYPMKRKNWAPGGGDKSLRGRDEWVRITWDEALDILASETKRIKEKYGNESMLWGTRSMALYGGYVSSWGILLFWHLGGNRAAGRWRLPVWQRPPGYAQVQAHRHVEHGPHVGQRRIATYNYLQAKKAGAKFIFIDPFYNDSAQVLADEWIPIRPGTDTAMLLAIGYTLITEDDPKTNPLIDWDFLNRCTIGFDKTSLPAGADPKENFKDYVWAWMPAASRRPRATRTILPRRRSGRGDLRHAGHEDPLLRPRDRRDAPCGLHGERCLGAHQQRTVAGPGVHDHGRYDWQRRRQRRRLRPDAALHGRQ